MQLNVSTCYAMQIVLYLTRKPKTVSSTELSGNLKISPRYILQITGKLRDGGLIRAHAGKSGGYTLDKEAASISIFDVIKLMEGDMSIPVCMSRIPDCGEPCKNSHLLDSLSVMKEYLDMYLQTIMFDELADSDISGHLSEVLSLVAAHIGDLKQNR